MSGLVPIPSYWLFCMRRTDSVHVFIVYLVDSNSVYRYSSHRSSLLKSSYVESSLEQIQFTYMFHIDQTKSTLLHFTWIWVYRFRLHRLIKFTQIQFLTGSRFRIYTCREKLIYIFKKDNGQCLTLEQVLCVSLGGCISITKSNVGCLHSYCMLVAPEGKVVAVHINCTCQCGLQQNL